MANYNTLLIPYVGIPIRNACMLVVIFLSACTSNSGNSTESNSNNSSSVKFDQYYVQGEKLYIEHCSNCHQEKGTGLGRLFPPLAVSDYMTNNFDSVVCLMRNGKRGSITVNGIGFNQEMKGIPALSDLEVAEIATYIYNTWQNQRGLVDVKEVSAIMAKCE